MAMLTPHLITLSIPRWLLSSFREEISNVDPTLAGLFSHVGGGGADIKPGVVLGIGLVAEKKIGSPCARVSGIEGCKLVCGDRVQVAMIFVTVVL